MTINELFDCDDLGETTRDSHAYRIQVALNNLNFRTVEMADPVPLGRQILTAAGVDARGEYSLFAILTTGDFEDIRLDESFNLRGRGVEQFVAFHADRDFKLTLNGCQIT